MPAQRPRESLPAEGDFRAFGRGSWMARKAGGAIQRLYRQSSPKTHLPHSLLSGLLQKKDTQHVTRPPSRLCPPPHFSTPQGFPRCLFTDSSSRLALAPASKAKLCHLERQTPCFTQLSLISAPRTFERPIVVPKWLVLSLNISIFPT